MEEDEQFDSITIEELAERTRLATLFWIEYTQISYKELPENSPRYVVLRWTVPRHRVCRSVTNLCFPATLSSIPTEERRIPLSWLIGPHCLAR